VATGLRQGIQSLYRFIFVTSPQICRKDMIYKSPLSLAFSLAFLFLISSCQINPKDINDIHLAFIVNSVSPMDGDPGSHITLRGTGFSKDSLENQVTVNGVNAKIVHSSTTSIEAVLPETDGITADVRLQVHQVASAKSFTFQYYDVYVAGSVTNDAGESMARLWKNGAVVPLALSSDSLKYPTAQALFVDDKDVYVGTTGGYFKNSRFVPVYSSSNQSIVVQDLQIHKGSVYVTAPKGYYKDGVFKSLISGAGPAPSINALLFDGDVMYAGGSDEYGLGAVEYKNDKSVSLDQNEFHSGINALIIHDHQIHAVGQAVASTPTDWINSKAHTVNVNCSILKDIQFIGNDEYLVGWPASKKHAYFLNGLEVKPRVGTYFEGRKLAVQGKNIYAAGVSAPSFSSPATDAAYYRNQELVTLNKGRNYSAQANAIVVVKR